jgi:hypothetical protein
MGNGKTAAVDTEKVESLKQTFNFVDRSIVTKLPIPGEPMVVSLSVAWATKGDYERTISVVYSNGKTETLVQKGKVRHYSNGTDVVSYSDGSYLKSKVKPITPGFDNHPFFKDSDMTANSMTKETIKLHGLEIRFRRFQDHTEEIKLSGKLSLPGGPVLPGPR